MAKINATSAQVFIQTDDDTWKNVAELVSDLVETTEEHELTDGTTIEGLKDLTLSFEGYLDDGYYERLKTGIIPDPISVTASNGYSMIGRVYANHASSDGKKLYEASSSFVPVKFLDPIGWEISMEHCLAGFKQARLADEANDDN